MKLVSDHLLAAIPLAEVWLASGRTENAARQARQALELARMRKQRGHEVYALRLLGEVARHRTPPRMWTMPRHTYGSALALENELGMRPLVAYCHLGLGRLYRRTGKREQAQEHLAIATAMYREMGTTYWLEKAEQERMALSAE